MAAVILNLSDKGQRDLETLMEITEGNNREVIEHALKLYREVINMKIGNEKLFYLDHNGDPVEYNPFVPEKEMEVA